MFGRVTGAGAVPEGRCNRNALHWDALRELPAMGEIAHRHAWHLRRCEKPGEAIYRAFGRATGFGGGEILFLDDLEEHCIAARACGWNVVRIDHERDTAAQILSAARAHGVGC